MIAGVGLEPNHVWAPCSLTYSQIHGLIKTGRFFENPLVGRHVVNELKVRCYVVNELEVS